jgi:hypothetical protein
MNRPFAFVSSLVLIASIGIPGSALAGERPTTDAAAARRAVLATIDRFEDEGHALDLLSPALPYAGGASITLVYTDEDANERRMTVNPARLAGGEASALDSFLGAMDPAFLSFVRSSVGDRMIRVRTNATALDRAEAALFFPTMRLRIASPEHPSAGFAETEYIPLAVD